jgi:hypothetical protein
MLGQTEMERERYEARRKAQLDYNTGMTVARMEGRVEGEVAGQARGIITMIHVSERLLNRPQTPAEQLAALALEDLTRMAEELQTHLLKQR